MFLYLFPLRVSPAFADADLLCSYLVLGMRNPPCDYDFMFMIRSTTASASSAGDIIPLSGFADQSYQPTASESLPTNSKTAKPDRKTSSISVCQVGSGGGRHVNVFLPCGTTYRRKGRGVELQAEARYRWEKESSWLMSYASSALSDLLPAERM
ncbi:hypothetical protein M432DRAFT_587058 [Thermoascus aurantiacus ATCC 26904]